MSLPKLHIELNPHVAAQTVLAYEEPEVVPAPVVRTSGTAETRVRSYFEDIPIMAQIAWCESRYTQIDPATGDVLRGMVNRADVGVMQINEYYHAQTARALGYDLHTLDGNLAYARNLYEREGTRPWNASRACWQSSGLALR